MGEHGIRYSAFGEEKTLSEWSRDPRCLVSYSVLYGRLMYGFDLEDAMTRPVRSKKPIAGTKIGSRKTARMLTAFGETKSVVDWSEDERCAVSLIGLCHRLNRGMDGEEAISSTKFIGDNFVAFGEEMSLTDWSFDPRCVVGYPTLRQRVMRGERLEIALTRYTNEIVSTHLMYEQ